MANRFTSKSPTLTVQQADQMLSNIFDICNVPPNTVPLETLESYSNYRAERFTFKRFLIGIIIAIFLLIPFLFITPSMTVENVSAPGDAPKYQVTVNSMLPVTSVTATIDDSNVPVFETGDNVYTIEPASSGNLVITANSVNKQYYQLQVDVFADRHDKEAPKLIRNEVSDGQVYMYLSDNESGIDYSSAYGLYNNGDRVDPVTFNSSENYLVFDYPKEDLNIYISDKDGNVLQLVVTVNK
ncbi:MAG: hypothetical protein KBS66_00985 [Eubacterium sp.]|nr:hypothetical protein [Candidatus Colimonas fimequi]